MLAKKIDTNFNDTNFKNKLSKSFFRHFAIILLIKIIAFTLIYNLYFKNSKVKPTPKSVEQHLGLTKE